MLNEIFEGLRRQLSDVLDDLLQLAGRLNDDALGLLVRDVRRNIAEPFLFVVVGEIKAGKSSFVNALLEAEICAVDPAPCTDKINLIGYADKEQENQLSDHLVRIGRPVEILKSIAIVDTPGTNTLIAHHQEITERFIPNSGLVLFVFPAKNPYTRSAWELLGFVQKKWRRRVVFILQQADLATSHELETNVEKVREYAADYDIEQPVIFPTSALWEQADDARSGFAAVRNFIKETVTGGRHLYLKLEAAAGTADKLAEQADATLERFRNVLTEESRTVDAIHRRLAEERERGQQAAASLTDALLQAYDRLGAGLRASFSSGLSGPALLKSTFGSIFSKEKSMQHWVEGLRRQFEKDLDAAATQAIAGAAAQMTSDLTHLVERLMEDLQRYTPEGQDPLVVDYVARREEIVAGVRGQMQATEISSFLSGPLAADSTKASSTLLGGGALTVLGTVLLAASHATFLDITGGVLTALGLLMAGGMVSYRRGRLLEALDEGLESGRRKLAEEVRGQVSQRFDHLISGLQQHFQPFFQYVQQREEQLKPLSDNLSHIRQKLHQFRQALQ